MQRAPNCKCGLPAKEDVVKKQGPHTGKPFYGCPTYPGGCGFFQWAPPPSVATSTSNSFVAVQQPQLQQPKPHPHEDLLREEIKTLRQRVDFLEEVIQTFARHALNIPDAKRKQ